MINELLFTEADNNIEIVVLANGVPIPFITNGATSVTVDLDGTSEWPTEFDDNGKIIITKPDGVELNVTSHHAIVRVYDDNHPNGQIIVHRAMSKSSMNIQIIEG